MSEHRLVLIETAAALPGLLPPVAHQAIAEVGRVLARDPEAHPSVPALAMAGIEVAEATPAEPADARGLNLLELGGSAGDVRLAKGVLAAAAEVDTAYLLGPEDEGFGRTVGIEAARSGDVVVEFVFLTGAPRGLELLRMVEVMAALRDPETGCPWDLEQDHASLAPHLVEEAYELLEAIDGADDDHLAEELGDVLLQVLFHAQIADERGAFDIDRVARGLTEKLVHRHPHVFGDGELDTPDQVRDQWEELKAAEKPERDGLFAGVPTALPALLFAAKLQRRAVNAGVEWSEDEDGPAAVRARAEALGSASPEEIEQAVGDLLFALTSLARQHEVDAESALRRSAQRFRARFEDEP